MGYEKWGFDEERVRNRVENRKVIKVERLKKKLENLMRRKHGEGPQESGNVVNLSGMEIPINVKEILEQGLKFCVKHGDEIEKLIGEVERIEDKDLGIEVFGEIERELRREGRQREEREGTREKLKIKEAKNWLSTNRLLVIKADKGGGICVIGQEEYDKKLKEVILNDKVKLEKKDPTRSLTIKVNKVINKNLIMNQDEKESLKATGCEAPKPKGLIKLHKDGQPCRPIIPMLKSPTRKLGQWLYDKIREYEFRSKWSCTGGEEISKEIREKWKIGMRFISMDVKDLYPSVPVREGIEILTKWMKEVGLVNKQEDEDDWKEICKVVVTSNYFEYEGQFYSIIEGSPMGSPLSGVLAELWLRKMEGELIEEEIVKGNIGWYRRYVDDIIIGYDDERKLTEMKNKIKNWHKNLVVTWEEPDEDGWLSFLDLKIKGGEELGIGIFRKEVSKPMYVRWDSYGDIKTKMSGLNYMCRRVWKYSINEEERKKEIRWIRKVFKEHGFPEQTVERCIFRWKMRVRKENQDEVKGRKEGRWTGLTYLRNVTERISRKLKINGRQVFVKKGKSLEEEFVGQKKKKDKKSIMDRRWDKKGVYRVQCGVCGRAYIGETGVSIKIRMKQHLREIKNKDWGVDKKGRVWGNAIAKHVWDGECKIKGVGELSVLHLNIQKDVSGILVC